jgi:hypothetical protein
VAWRVVVLLVAFVALGTILTTLVLLSLLDVHPSITAHICPPDVSGASSCAMLEEAESAALNCSAAADAMRLELGSIVTQVRDVAAGLAECTAPQNDSFVLTTDVYSQPPVLVSTVVPVDKTLPGAYVFTTNSYVGIYNRVTGRPNYYLVTASSLGGPVYAIQNLGQAGSDPPFTIVPVGSVVWAMSPLDTFEPVLFRATAARSATPIDPPFVPYQIAYNWTVQADDHQGYDAFSVTDTQPGSYVLPISGNYILYAQFGATNTDPLVSTTLTLSLVIDRLSSFETHSVTVAIPAAGSAIAYDSIAFTASAGNYVYVTVTAGIAAQLLMDDTSSQFIVSRVQ